MELTFLKIIVKILFCDNKLFYDSEIKRTLLF